MKACESLKQPSPSNASVTMPTSGFPTSHFGSYMPPHHLHPTNIQYYDVSSSHVYPPVRPPPNLQHQYKRYQKKAPSPNPGFKIRYVLCTDLFINNQEELFLCVQPEGDTMEHLINLICHTHSIPESLTLELFSEEGSPLNVNSFTMKSKQVLHLYNLVLKTLPLGSGKCLILQILYFPYCSDLSTMEY